jgi:O-antigen/teichoic acid export membrane protein
MAELRRRSLTSRREPAPQVVRETADRSGAAQDRQQLLPAADRIKAATSHRAISAGASGIPSDGRGIGGDRVRHDNRRIRPEDAYRARQEAGLAALVAIASQGSFPVLPLWPPGPLDGVPSGRRHDAIPADSAAEEELGPVGSLLSRLRGDHLVRNSLYLMASNGIQAVLGFGFWILMARLFSTADVGKASSLVSATTLLSFFALFGLNTTVMRFLPTARNKGALLTAVFVLVAAVACVMAVGYVMLTPVIAPHLDFVAHSPLMTAGFAALAAAAAVNVLTDSVFMASRRSEFCVVTDGLVGSGGRIIFGVILAGTGSYGLYLASVGGSAAAAVASIILIITIFRWRPSLANALHTLRPLLKYSGANYIANSMNLLPNVVVPLIVLDRLGAQAAGYYYVAFQMATLLFTAAAVIEASFMAEGSQAGANWRVIRRRSRRLAIMIFVPAGIVVALTAHWMLLAFGPGYSLHGTGSLEILAAAVLPVAACNWGWTVLRLTGRLRSLLVSTAFYGVAVCASAWFLAPHGLTALSAGWLAGSTVAAVVSTILAAAVRAPARHRRGMRPRTEAGVAQP